MKIISGSIDVTKLDKARFVAGKKGTYANLSIRLSDELDQYGNNGFIAENVSKEEREQGIKGTILGNVKVVWTDEATPQPEYSSEAPLDDTIPF